VPLQIGFVYESMMEPEAELNRQYWKDQNRSTYDASAASAWQQAEIAWGIYQVPERQLEVLGDVGGLDVIELGCGTAYFSAWLARRGARPIGIDVTPEQLATARRCQQQFGLEFPLIEASAVQVPRPDASFDLALSEYGACLWCEPDRWLPEAARLLRPGGRLVFLTNSLLVTLCIPDEDGQPAQTQLLRPQAAVRRQQWPTGGVEFHLGHGEWIELLRRHGFEIERMVELYAPTDATHDSAHMIAGREWAQRWPIEEIWVVRKR
jgi:SAM-dependent methyltransferase